MPVVPAMQDAEAEMGGLWLKANLGQKVREILSQKIPRYVW
jgi:hypothetical protein